MDTVDLYQAVGGRKMCLELSKAFYARVQQDPVLRPLFPGKTLHCAVEAFAAFLAQFLGGPAREAERRWFLSLRESHLRFEIGPRQRQAWMKNMVAALEEMPVDEPLHAAMRDLFERSSAYLVNTGQGTREPDPPAVLSDNRHREIAQRWAEQRDLDDLVEAVRIRDADRSLALAQGRALQARFARDRAVFAHALGLMMGCGHPALLEYAARAIMADPALPRIRNRYGRTLLHDACGQANLPMVELLLRLGADPNGEALGGRTPLYCVANDRFQGGAPIVHALVRAGAPVDAQVGVKRCTALHVAARRGNTEVAEALLDCGADMNLKDTAGVTPLMRARNCRKPAVVSLLVSRAAEAR